MLFILFCLLAGTNSVLASWWDSTEYYHGELHLPIDTLVILMGDEQILLIDTREPEEYQESHIPTAINIPLRHAQDLRREDLVQYRYVVPYCLKDFRAFEMAKYLMKLGLKNVRLMDPAGFNGWRENKLPLVTPDFGETQALEVLDNQQR